MATDFTNNGKTILSNGGFKPAIQNTPLDARTRVNLKADIDGIPNPFVGMHIVVLQDETNDNEMTEYVVKSLTANSLGVADAKINELVLVKDFLGIDNSSDDSVDLSEYVTKTELNENLSTKANVSDIPSLSINKPSFVTITTGIYFKSKTNVLKRCSRCFIMQYIIFF